MAKITLSARIDNGMEILINGNIYTVTQDNKASNALLDNRDLKSFRLYNQANGRTGDYHLRTLIENEAEIVSYPRYDR